MKSGFVEIVNTDVLNVKPCKLAMCRFTPREFRVQRVDDIAYG